jgi:hypothetical protein
LHDWIVRELEQAVYSKQSRAQVSVAFPNVPVPLYEQAASCDGKRTMDVRLEEIVGSFATVSTAWSRRLSETVTCQQQN